MGKKLTFEAGYEKLEALTAALEKGEMPLDASFAAYEESVALLKTLTKMLDEGEGKLTELTSAGETPLSGIEEEPV